MDFIINNEDRHLFNFGFLRDPASLELLSAAPVYDSGLSLFYSWFSNTIDEQELTISKPFMANHRFQMRLASDFSWLDGKKLRAVPELIHGILLNFFIIYNVGEDPKRRAETIAGYLKKESWLWRKSRE